MSLIIEPISLSRSSTFGGGNAITADLLRSSDSAAFKLIWFTKRDYDFL